MRLKINSLWVYLSFINFAIMPKLQKTKTGINISLIPDTGLATVGIVGSVTSEIGKECNPSWRNGLIPTTRPVVKLEKSFKCFSRDYIAHVLSPLISVIKRIAQKNRKSQRLTNPVFLFTLLNANKGEEETGTNCPLLLFMCQASLYHLCNMTPKATVLGYIAKIKATLLTTLEDGGLNRLNGVDFRTWLATRTAPDNTACETQLQSLSSRTPKVLYRTTVLKFLENNTLYSFMSQRALR